MKPRLQIFCFILLVAVASVALQWEARNATSVWIEPELGSIQIQGSRLPNPSSSLTYIVTATGPGGSTSDRARTTVRVPAAAAPRNADSRAASLLKNNVQAIHFDYDQSNIRSDQVLTLNANALWLKEHSDVKFRIEGHCDERGSEEYNLGLGDRRANRVKKLLIQQGIDVSRIRTVSYGEEHPACRHATEKCYQQNRRAEFVLDPTS